MAIGEELGLLLTTRAVEALGIEGSAVQSYGKAAAEDAALPADMSAMSLLGGGLIAGDALAALGLGIAGLLATVVA